MGGVRIAITPIRVSCSNMLNLAFRRAARSWSVYHTGAIGDKLDIVQKALLQTDLYMKELEQEAERLQHVILTDTKAYDLLDKLLPFEEKMTELQMKNLKSQREDLMQRYFEAPDLKDLGRTGYRFLNAVSDYATHAEPLRRTKTYQENLFAKSVDGLSILDRAYQLLQAA